MVKYAQPQFPHQVAPGDIATPQRGQVVGERMALGGPPGLRPGNPVAVRQRGGGQVKVARDVPGHHPSPRCVRPVGVRRDIGERAVRAHLRTGPAHVLAEPGTDFRGDRRTFAQDERMRAVGAESAEQVPVRRTADPGKLMRNSGAPGSRSYCGNGELPVLVVTSTARALHLFTLSSDTEIFRPVPWRVEDRARPAATRGRLPSGPSPSVAMLPMPRPRIRPVVSPCRRGSAVRS
jgi:hypothetical protein